MLVKIQSLPAKGLISSGLKLAVFKSKTTSVFTQVNNHRIGVINLVHGGNESLYLFRAGIKFIKPNIASRTNAIFKQFVV